MSIQTMPALDLRRDLHSILGELDSPLFITTHGRVIEHFGADHA